ncbi:acetyltransferase [Actinopolymorpha sp. B11F2]|uniref:acetyltransferase n=1 Tax=Actinopolymorpha sp. B11F2 TaxID=3160862 RepID=UPI0032E50673
MTLYIVGAGGFGRETYDAVLAARDHADRGTERGHEGRGYDRGQAAPVVFCDHSRAGERIRGLTVIHPDDADPDSDPADETGAGFVVAIADPAVRMRLSAEFAARGFTPRTVVHPRAVIGPETTVGAGSVILALAHVSSSCVLGRHTQVNYTASVGHDAALEDFATVFPGANVAGDVRLGQGVTIGSNACVLQGLEVGSGAYVGAGAVVTRSVTAGTTVVGVPARPLTRSATAPPG